MRRPTDTHALQQFLRELGREARRRATLYLVGGATAIMEGWRPTTIDVDLRLEPELDELLHALPGLKERLGINVKLASPLDFLPEPPGWRDRSPLVAQEGLLTIRHFDLVTQALAKLERGFDQDLRDVDEMLGRGLVDVSALRRVMEEIEPQLYRDPAVDPIALRAAVEAIAQR